MLSVDEVVRMVVIGVGATVVMDIWSMIQRALGIPTLNYAMVGRWAGHFCQGRLAHDNIAKATPVSGELLMGWTIHYAVGIAFAAMLVGVFGIAWIHEPTLLEALIVGVVTVLIPFFVMQPAMGAGIAASHTPTPWKNRWRSLMTHGIFGLGMYLSAVLLNKVWG
jgi:hypothetical protein